MMANLNKSLPKHFHEQHKWRMNRARKSWVVKIFCLYIVAITGITCSFLSLPFPRPLPPPLSFSLCFLLYVFVLANIDN